MKNFRIVKYIDGNGKECFRPQSRFLWFFWGRYGDECGNKVEDRISYEGALSVIKGVEERKRGNKRRKCKIFSVKI